MTVDTEALPKRAAQSHVDRLIWGQCESGRAGIRELCSVGNEFNAKHVFFVDLCATYACHDEMREVIRWLDSAGQDVQLHAHPEVLPASFWQEHGFASNRLWMNEEVDHGRTNFAIGYFSKQIARITGKDVLAFRAGSFRWSASTIRALKEANIPVSFNNTMRAYRAGRCAYSEPTNRPYMWSNGIIEVPLTEKYIPPRAGKGERWASLSYPESSYFSHTELKRDFFSCFSGDRHPISVLLLHSWSLLHWNEEGHAIYRDDERLEGYRKLLSRMTKDYDIITTRDFLDLHSRGEIHATHTVDLNNAEPTK
ncbi:polysaccharide deacetylase [Paraburkholderia dipogonis]|uniref:Polysaccharide deacetylase n=1 Tax=Paraburkholderia dipogonis TaxID=1211383 RepID=A0ABW9B3S0_9BURK